MNITQIQTASFDQLKTDEYTLVSIDGQRKWL